MSLRCSLGLKIMLLGLAMLRFSTPGFALVWPTWVERDMAGTIVATQEDRVSVSEGDTVLLDRGRAGGVEIGNHYVVFQDPRTVIHPYSGRALRILPEAIGEIRVVDVHERTSRALVLRSIREVNVGAVVAPMRGGQSQEGRLDEMDWRSQAQTRLGQLNPCLEMTRQAVQEAESTGVNTSELTEAKGTLARAELALAQANALVLAGEHERAAHRLEAGLTDCLHAEELTRQSGSITVGTAPGLPTQYTVQRGDTLWGISGSAQIYRNPFMWPLIHKANQQQIHDPDRIYPRQTFQVPRDYTPEEATRAVQQAQQRGAWRQGDGR